MVGRSAIAFCGTRGLPANYGGFETAVDEITRRFIRKGYPCDVFCRESSSSELLDSHEDRRLVYVSGSRFRQLDTFMSSIQTGWHLWRHRRRYKYVFWFNNANFPGILITILAGIPTSVNTDGLEWRRAKWSLPFKAYYFLSSFLICRLCKTLIADSRAIQAYYKKLFSKATEFIPYGTPSTAPFEFLDNGTHKAILAKHGLVEGRYFLQITRFEPDNLPLEVAEGFRKSGLWKDGFKMVLVGYKDATAYASKIKSLAGQDGVVVMDAIYDPQVLFVLRRNCFCYVHGNSVGGTNPALLEAMATCPRIMAVNGPFSREVLGELGLFFDHHDILSSFKSALSLGDQSLPLRQRVSSLYRWDEVAESYVRLAKGGSAAYQWPDTYQFVDHGEGVVLR